MVEPRILFVPLRVASATNLREHWSQRHRRIRHERAVVAMVLRTTWGSIRPLSSPLTVTLTRIAPRQLDGDNLQAALKGPRDQIAAWLGCDDNDARLTWRYAQERRGVREYGVLITLTED